MGELRIYVFLLLKSICSPTFLFNFDFLFWDSDETANEPLKSPEGRIFRLRLFLFAHGKSFLEWSY